MPKRIPARIALLSALALFSATSAAAPSCQPRISAGWIRLTPGGMDMLAGYGRIENPCQTPATVTGASSRDFADVSLHASSVAAGMSRMRPVPRLALEPGRTVAMEPGGLHLMLMQPTRVLKAGDELSIDFTLADGRRLSGDFRVRAMTP